MSDQFNDPRAEAPASGAEFSADPTGTSGAPLGGPAEAAGVTGGAGRESALDGPAAASGTPYVASDVPPVDTVDTTSPAKQGAQQVGDQASQSAQDTMDTAKQEAGNVAATAKDQARRLADQTRSELTDQARTQQNRLAGSLRDLGQQFGQMADQGDSSSMAAQLAQQASDQAHSLGSWLESREPGDVLDEVKRFARRKPGTFLAVAAGVGFLSGRLTRSLTGDSNSSNGDGRDPLTSSYSGAYTDRAGRPSRYESTTSYDAATGTTTTTYGTTGARDTDTRTAGTGGLGLTDPPRAGAGTGTMGTDFETGTSTTGQTGQISEASKPSAATAPGAPPAEATGSAWEEGER